MQMIDIPFFTAGGSTKIIAPKFSRDARDRVSGEMKRLDAFSNREYSTADATKKVELPSRFFGFDIRVSFFKNGMGTITIDGYVFEDFTIQTIDACKEMYPSILFTVVTNGIFEYAKRFDRGDITTGKVQIDAGDLVIGVIPMPTRKNETWKGKTTVSGGSDLDWEGYFPLVVSRRAIERLGTGSLAFVRSFKILMKRKMEMIRDSLNHATGIDIDDFLRELER